MGTCDCGLFSIAYATSLAYGEDPSYSIFSQSQMRAHLYQCFVKGRLTPFPCTKRYMGVAVPGNFKPKCRDDIEVHCHCRMPELKDVPMIECTKCNKWFHIDCEAVPEEILNNSKAEWFCKHCN